MAAFGLPGGGDTAVIAAAVSPEGNKGLLFHRLPEYFVKLTPRPIFGRREAAKRSGHPRFVIGQAAWQGAATTWQAAEDVAA
ncbi:hypothetical protein [Bradyrhizobium sp. SZCCHNR1047]|uniref:hypothetical protein n=1 Tax=Bradyrhizobium sp. SZCCHNR1047 TaxID=3057354 RepID=UPI002915D268|nr:hypothetical protein [Bradyrhizobium sp. SZCCHNR1047]